MAEQRKWGRKAVLPTARDLKKVELTPASTELVNSVKESGDPAFAPLQSLSEKEILERIRRDYWGL